MADNGAGGGRIAVSCPCGARFSVEGKFAGRQGTCPKCRMPLLVPGAARNVCPQCGVANPVEELFCAGCGGSLLPDDPAADRRSTPNAPTEVRAGWSAEEAAQIRGERGPERTTEVPRVGVPAAPAPKVTIRVAEGVVPVPAPAAPAPAPAAPPPAEPAPAPRRTPVLRNKLAEIEAPRRPLLLRIFVFLLLAGGGGTGAFYLGRSTFEPAIAKHAAEEARVRRGQWPGRTLEKLKDDLVALSPLRDPKNPGGRATPEEAALRQTIEDEFARLKKESQEAAALGDAAHGRLQNWQLGWYAYIGVAGLALGLIGWRLSR